MGFDENHTHCSLLFEPGTALTVYPEDTPDLSQYVEFIVFFSGGKDSVACVLHLLELGVSPAKIEIHHHLIDGNEGKNFMDWPVTTDYCRKFAQAFGIRFVMTWRVGGFEREMLRENSPTAPVMVPQEDGTMVATGGKGPNGTRRKFPQACMDIQTRWCSGYTKIDVGARYLTSTARFHDGQKRLILTGERAEESPSRAKYETFFKHAKDKRHSKTSKRHLDHWRAVHRWSESEVWSIMERHGVNPHPAYWIGYSRCSCAGCIFVGNDNWATLKFIAPKMFNSIAAYETAFGMTMHRKLNVNQRADAGTVMPMAQRYGQIAMRKEYLEPILVSDWKLPTGAFKANGGKF
ncbi:conserved hypothetical protein (plasmid) [Rhodoferax ferrireducens T118]|uniref:Phosphoadenosine phosphosulphate reductase domain-containing protein n=1 Tax=Albidiferax ferrireducens (strain ATCC BAA-621 / DSM 15236 / T118) TaxID=338969 RepID=Q21QD7_ALBFT|nr:phosphoadenosine phosphosulfate reductase family protein [Rhodoferax ferrireducens]ABD72008.1 conserved hypothetical protein [Rhodoferax ferrireducens T118]